MTLKELFNQIENKENLYYRLFTDYHEILNPVTEIQNHHEKYLVLDNRYCFDLNQILKKNKQGQFKITEDRKYEYLLEIVKLERVEF